MKIGGGILVLACPDLDERVRTTVSCDNTVSRLPNGRTTMNILELDSLELDSTAQTDFRLARSLRWWDSNAECTLVLSQPSTDPDLWTEYLEGAQRSYRKHGVECALDVDAIRSGDDTVLFWAAVDETAKVVAGVRAKGPLRSADESHALVEWAGQSGEQAVRKMITDRLPFGVLEMKSAWSTDQPKRNRSLTKAIARSGFHAMSLLDVQFCMATGATRVLDRWRSSGGVLAPKIPATPYPNERYRTKMMWWDRRTFVKYAEQEQVSKILMEITGVTRDWRRAGGIVAARQEVL